VGRNFVLVRMLVKVSAGPWYLAFLESRVSPLGLGRGFSAEQKGSWQ
jgi:hypothetical protein